MAALKVCYLLKRYPRLSQTFIVNEMLALKRLGCDLVIVASKGSDETLVHEKCHALDTPVYYMPQLSEDLLSRISVTRYEKLAASPVNLNLKTLSGGRLKKDVATLLQVAMTVPLIQSLGIDHIHGHFATWGATAGSMMSAMTGIPYSFTAHARDIFHQSIQNDTLAARIAQARFTITVSDYNKRYLDRILKTHGRQGNVIRLYNGMDLNGLCPKADEKEPKLFVSVGRLVRKKGFQYLIAACKQLKNIGKSFRCVIIGEGEERRELEALLAEDNLEKEVRLVGAKPQGEVLNMIRRATAFVLPCIVTEDGDRDALPTVILEAMALGTPVISTNIVGIPEMISNGVSGLLVPEKDTRGLAGAMEKLLVSREAGEGFAAAARSKVIRDFDLDKNAMKLKTYFLSGVSKP
ncbi:MAG: glycosyltransferase [Nitrospiria bacterium]